MSLALRTLPAAAGLMPVATEYREPEKTTGRTPRSRTRLRVALIAGALGYAGAAKQALYMARALHEADVDIRVFSITPGQFYGPSLQSLGIEPEWFGGFCNPLIRLAVLTTKLSRFRPHFVQSANFFTNFYAGLAGRLCGAVTVGALRSDLTYELEQHRASGRWLLRLPAVIVANSQAARRNVGALGINPKKIHVLPNVIDLAEFDARRGPQGHGMRAPVAAVVGTLLPVKHFDRFLEALALARRSAPALQGIVLGDGPERGALERRARNLGLLPDAVRFLGHRQDVPALLSSAGMQVISSDHEGFPNVVLEGMAAGLPVVTTPAGDAGSIVEDGTTGYVVPFHDVEAMAASLARLARSPALRKQMGLAARQRVQRNYSFTCLADRLLGFYRDFARQLGKNYLLRYFPA